MSIAKAFRWYKRQHWFIKYSLGMFFLAAAVVLTIETGGTVGALLIELAIGIGFGVAGYLLSSLLTQQAVTWSGLGNAVLDSFLFTSAFLFISSSINAIKYLCRSKPVTTSQLAQETHELTDSELRSFGERGHSQGFRQTVGTHDDAMEFFRSQTVSYDMIESGKYLGKNSRNIIFVIYDQPATRLGAYTSIRIYGVQGLKGIKFMWP